MLVYLKFPTFKTKGSSTPNEYLVVCTSCGKVNWTIYVQDMPAYCIQCEKRMREATPEEYAKAREALERII